MFDNIEFSGGSMSLITDDNIIDFGNINEFTTESTCECKNISDTVIQNTNNFFEFESELTYFKEDLFNKMFEPQDYNSFTLKYNAPVMIQARWHKKARIRKKWLKRYGMKPDVIPVVVDNCELEYNPGKILGYTDDSILSSYNNYEIKTTNLPRYIFKPYQMRRGLKISEKTY